MVQLPRDVWLRIASNHPVHEAAGFPSPMWEDVLLYGHFHGTDLWAMPDGWNRQLESLTLRSIHHDDEPTRTIVVKAEMESAEDIIADTFRSDRLVGNWNWDNTNLSLALCFLVQHHGQRVLTIVKRREELHRRRWLLLPCLLLLSQGPLPVEYYPWYLDAAAFYASPRPKRNIMVKCIILQHVRTVIKDLELHRHLLQAWLQSSQWPALPTQVPYGRVREPTDRHWYLYSMLREAILINDADTLGRVGNAPWENIANAQLLRLIYVFQTTPDLVRSVAVLEGSEVLTAAIRRPLALDPDWE
jgi:hypothetical protein